MLLCMMAAPDTEVSWGQLLEKTLKGSTTNVVFSGVGVDTHHTQSPLSKSWH